MIKYSFSDSDRLAEALDTKWVRRVSGFYRCSLDEKGYFANLEWDPANLFYLECACDLYAVLVTFDNGVSFLGSDRRGMLFNEIAGELEQLVFSADKGWSSAISASGFKNIFRISTSTQSMVREFFTLVGRMCTSKAGRRLLDSTSVFSHLSVLGSSKQLDYLSRIVITGLAFTDKGFLSQNLIQIWTTSENSSFSLKLYIHTLLLALLRSNPEEFLRWGVNTIVNQLLLEEFPSETLLLVVEEAIQDPTILRALVHKRPTIANLPILSKIPVRMLSCSEGVEYLRAKGFLSSALLQWQESECSNYPLAIESGLARALSKQPPAVIQPIVIPVIDGATTAKSNDQSSSSFLEGACGNNLFAGEAIDLEGLMRIPWNIEVKLSTQANFSQGSHEYLRVDAYFGE